ncbi:SDR family oxidoreductase [Celeribacter sp.]|uniref:SDR family oxidoreductase n=1 Tax=Celeribacter sp. TaxID=1890673 RepID=UPI003A943EA4
MTGLTGKIAVITGGTQGLGAAIARNFAEAGAEGLVLCGRNADNGTKVAQEIEAATGVPALFQPADLADVDQSRAVIAAADTRFGRVDILVNAAGLTQRGNLLDTTPELFDRMFAVNVRGPFFLMQEAAKVMIREGIEGAMVNIGSISETAGQPFISPYVASKGALASLTRNSAFALMRNRIRVNQLDIGWMASDNEKALQAAERGDENWLDEVARHMPFGRLIDPVEVARVVTFLASDDSGMMTGAVVPFDQSVTGGFAASPPVPNAPLAL